MTRTITVFALAIAALLGAPDARAQDIKVGVVYDLSGPLATSGSRPGQLGTRIAIDMINERGGVEGRRIVPVYADAKSKTDIALRETERLLDEEKVDLLMGFFSSAQCDAIAAKAEAARKFAWLNICVATSVMRDKKLQYVFRAQVHSDQFGEASCHFVAEKAKSKFDKDPKDLRVAIIYENGPYGSGIAGANEASCRALGLQVLLKEGYVATTNDLTALVTKLRRAQPDVILHTGYKPDIGLFLRQAREAGLKWGALIGHGAGYAHLERLSEASKLDVDYILNVDPVEAQLLDPKLLKPGIGEVTEEVTRRYRAESGSPEVPTHVWSGFNQTWILLSDVLPRAIRNHGGTDSEALRKAALETDIPEGGTVQGYGVKFPPPDTPLAGQNERAEPAIMQYVKGQTKVVAPAEIRPAEAVLPLPKGHTYGHSDGRLR